jgi:hypothetical protein
MPIESRTQIGSQSWSSPRGFHARREAYPKKVADLVKNKLEKV